MTAPDFELAGIGVRFGNVAALSDVALKIGSGELVTVAGPNGAGKSTLLRVLAGLQPATQGSALMRGRPLADWGRPELARTLAFVAQHNRMVFPYSARDVVLMGRLPHQADRFFESRDDALLVAESMEATGCSGLADRVFHTLSGGEQQLVVLAAALAQEPAILLLDEPTAFLDLRHQLQIASILRRLHARQGLTIVMATHDLSLAAALSDRLVLLKGGTVMAEVTADSGLTPDLVGRLFDLEAAEIDGAGGRRIEVRFGE